MNHTNEIAMFIILLIYSIADHDLFTKPSPKNAFVIWLHIELLQATVLFRILEASLSDVVAPFSYGNGTGMAA